MNASEKEPTGPVVRFSRRRTDFLREVMRRSGVNINRCWQCKCCSGGCPFSDSMDVNPNQLLRLVQLGFKDEALKSSTIWICVGCNTCSKECPQSIDMSAVMDSLRRMAIDEGLQVGQPDILNFHREVLNSIQRYGRTHKLEIMLRYKLYKRDWFSDMNVGLKMMAKRKLHLVPSKVSDLDCIKQIFSKAQQTRSKGGT